MSIEQINRHADAQRGHLARTSVVNEMWVIKVDTAEGRRLQLIRLKYKMRM